MESVSEGALAGAELGGVYWAELVEAKKSNEATNVE